MPPAVTLEISVETLVERHPDAVAFLMERGIRCVQCGEPVWGTLAELVRGTDAEREKLVTELNAFLGASP